MEKNIPKWPPYWQTGVIKTANSMGIMTTELSPSSKEFIEYCKVVTKPVLDIGCAFGSATFPALNNGAEVIACDICKTHLDFIAENVDSKLSSKLKLVHGDFLKNLYLEPKSLSAIHISMVLHFLTGDQIKAGLKKCLDWLEPNGKLFILNMTADLGIYNQQTLKAEINKKKLRGDKFPGEINERDFAREDYITQIPEFAHFFDYETLGNIIKSSGFEIECINYFCFDEIPQFYKTNGKEYIAAIAKKKL